MLRLFHRMAAVVRGVRHVPRGFRLACELIDAQADAASGDYSAAQRRLDHVFDLDLPDGMLQRSTADLLLSLVSLRLGNLQLAADRALTGVRNIDLLGAYVNADERAYLKYSGRLIFEEATDKLGRPKTINVGVDFDELDARRVRDALSEAYPVYRSRYWEMPVSH